MIVAAFTTYAIACPSDIRVGAPVGAGNSEGADEDGGSDDKNDDDGPTFAASVGTACPANSLLDSICVCQYLFDGLFFLCALLFDRV